MPSKISIAVIALVLAQGALAKTVYIRDTLYVPLRGGQSQEHRILHRGLRSGTPLELLEENEDTGYTRVRTEDGDVGWIQSQYLQDEPIAETQLQSARDTITELEASHQQALLRIQELESANEELAAVNEKLSARAEQLAEALDALQKKAADVLAIDEKNQTLTEENQALKAEVEALTESNQALQDDKAQQWFLRGAGTVFLGLLFGFWVARRIYTRRSGWWA